MPPTGIKVKYDPARIEGNDRPRTTWGKPLAWNRWTLTKQYAEGKVINLGCSGNLGGLRADLHVDADPGPFVDGPVPEPFLQADIRHVPRPDDSFDTAVLGDVIEHFASDAEAIECLREAARLAKRVIISTPREDRLLDKTFWLNQDDSGDNHRLWVDDWRLWGWLREAGLHVLTWHTISYDAFGMYLGFFVVAQREDKL